MFYDLLATFQTILFYCLSVLQELFAQCGADKADDASWLKLGEIHLPHNGLTELDSSLVRY